MHDVLTDQKAFVSEDMCILLATKTEFACIEDQYVFHHTCIFWIKCWIKIDVSELD